MSKSRMDRRVQAKHTSLTTCLCMYWQSTHLSPLMASNQEQNALVKKRLELNESAMLKSHDEISFLVNLL